MEVENIVLDIVMDNYDVLKSVQGDNGRTINVKIVSNGKVVNLDDYLPTLVIVKPDNTEIFNSCKALDSKQGILQIELTEQINAAAGILKCCLQLFGKEKQLVSTTNFKIEVNEGLSPKTVTSSNEYTQLTEALSTVKNMVCFREI
jgi:hypothetical protein|nr:MAG TPA: Baseplate component [Caudoviricetes sp.]